MNVYLIAIAATGLTLGWVYAFLLGCQTWESRRYARGRRQHLSPLKDDQQRVALFIPCKGYDLQLTENLTALFKLDYPHYQLVFIVENDQDPAFETIHELIRRRPEVPARTVIAGQCTDSGQKVHNLLVATDQVPADVDVLVFVDSDARPHRGWLRCLLTGLAKDGIGATTGYRWMLPLRRRFSNYLLYSINSATAVLFGRGGPVPVWGGSWAIRREVFEAIRLRDAWRGTLSDDMVATRVIYKAGYRVFFEPRCVTASPVDTTMLGAMEFLRRQFLIGRKYSFRMWSGAFAAQALSQVALWGSLALGFWAVAVGNTLGLLGFVNFVALYGGTVFRCWLRQEVGRHCFPRRQEQLTHARWFDILAGPALGPFNLLGFVSSCFGSCITWRDIRYRIHRGGQISLLDDPRNKPVILSMKNATSAPLEKQHHAA